MGPNVPASPDSPTDSAQRVGRALGVFLQGSGQPVPDDLDRADVVTLWELARGAGLNLSDVTQAAGL